MCGCVDVNEASELSALRRVASLASLARCNSFGLEVIATAPFSPSPDTNLNGRWRRDYSNRPHVA